MSVDEDNLSALEGKVSVHVQTRSESLGRLSPSRSESPTAACPPSPAHPVMDMVQCPDILTTDTLSSLSSFPIPHRPSAEVYASSHSHWFVRVVLLLIAFLHTQYHLSFRGCNLILASMHTIFLSLSLIPPDDLMPQTLTSTFKQLELGDHFQIFPACEVCMWIFEPSAAANTSCPDCKKLLFNVRPSTLFECISKKVPAPSPKLEVPFQSPCSLLSNMLAQPHIEQELEAWMACSRSEGTYREIMDGAVWKTMKTATGDLFLILLLKMSYALALPCL